MISVVLLWNCWWTWPPSCRWFLAKEKGEAAEIRQHGARSWPRICRKVSNVDLNVSHVNRVPAHQGLLISFTPTSSHGSVHASINSNLNRLIQFSLRLIPIHIVGKMIRCAFVALIRMSWRCVYMYELCRIEIPCDFNRLVTSMGRSVNRAGPFIVCVWTV